MHNKHAPLIINLVAIFTLVIITYPYLHEPSVTSTTGIPQIGSESFKHSTSHIYALNIKCLKAPPTWMFSYNYTNMTDNKSTNNTKSNKKKSNNTTKQYT